MLDVHSFLTNSNTRPKLTVYLRIDGPGSSLDLRLWQQSFWKLKEIPQEKDISMAWSQDLPRTIGISINVGIEIIAKPIRKGKLCVESVDYGFCYTFDKGKIPPLKENWLLRIMETFDLDGIKFVIKNQHPMLKSAGLGGSAAVTMGVCLMANYLTGNKFSNSQLIGMASIIEQDFEISLTGTQEQSCVMYGGVRDYLWYPFGIPSQDNFYGTSKNQEILSPEDYHELEKRMDIYFCIQRDSTDVNAVWKKQLQKSVGFNLHAKKLKLAYDYKEAIRNKNWSALSAPIEEYRKVRTELCSNYMSEASREIDIICKQHNAVCFPLGGGGGSVMVYSPDPNNLISLREILTKKFKLINYKISPIGHKFEQVSDE